MLCGCVSSSAKFPGLMAPSAGKAALYIYRVDLYVNPVRIAPNVRVNYENVGVLLKHGYFHVEVDPGPTQVALYRFDKGDDSDIYWPSAHDAVVNLNLAPNSTHFVAFTLDRPFFSFKETSRERALWLLPGLDLLN